ncbi:MAG: type II toxin-antitoxin system VapC family toxin [Trichloromonadaceae bacterium]
MTSILIDTSAWIDFFRNQSGAVGDIVATLIERDQAVMTGPVLAELLQGLKSRQEINTLRELFDVLPYIETSRRDWEQTGDLLRKLRQRGITVPLTDALIASVAKRTGGAVLTLDRHFEHLEVPLHPIHN